MRSTKEVFESHLMFTLDWDIDTDIETNYSSDCFLLTSYGAFLGRMGIKKAYSFLESQIPDADFLYCSKSFHNNVAFLEWQAESDDTYVDNGANTYVVDNGKIVAQTIHYTVKVRKK